MRRRIIIVAGVFLFAAAGWLLWAGGARWTRHAVTQIAAPASGQNAQPQRKITATLFFVSEDGMALVPVQREVPFGEPVVEQARFIVEAQIAEAPQPLASAIPPGTTLRAIYLSEKGDLFLDLSLEISKNHTGGALDELFTVYTFVNALTVSLPAIQRVQILVDGKEVDTLAGHVDLRNPLTKNTNWVRTDNPS